MPKRSPARRPPPSGAPRLLDRAITALRTQRLDEAERLARELLRSDRDDGLAARILGQALFGQGRAREAVEPLELAARRSGDPDTDVWLARALAADQQGEAALAPLRRATSRRPPFPLAFLELGDRLRELARYDESAAVLERGLALTPNAVILRMGLGYTFLQRGDRARARAAFLRVRAEAPERQDAVAALGRTLALDGDYAGAADLYRRALDLRPEDALTRIELGRCLLELGEREAGEAALRAAARAAPHLTGLVLTALAATPHGRFFLRPSAADAFLG